ncbi:MAG: hypothetical protein WAP55_00020 [Minisyncoccia bacterium]
MDEDRVLFKNELFLARVTGKGDGLIQCVPVVYNDVFHCGVGVFYEDGKGQIWGLVSPRNLIAAWRGTEVLRRLKVIEHGTLCAAYYTGVRHPHKSHMESHVEPTIAKIGRAVYDKIMAMPVPEEIVRAILDNQKGDLAPDLYPITDEVRAGTIQWRQEFADAGIKHPDEIDTKKRAQEETVARFERLLASYASSRSLSRQCMGMDYVEGTLLTLIDKGAGQIHSDCMLVALAGVVSELAVRGFASSFIDPRSREEYSSWMDKTKEEAIDHSAAWLVFNSGLLQFFFGKRRWKNLLYHLLEEYFPSKSEVVPA